MGTGTTLEHFHQRHLGRRGASNLGFFSHFQKISIAGLGSTQKQRILKNMQQKPEPLHRKTQETDARARASGS